MDIGTMNVETLALTANVEMPLVVDVAGDVNWTESADLVVVGFGGAGVVACLQALETGASVIALDRFEGGGATAKSGGVVYAGGTPFQKQAGFDDSTDEMYKYLAYEGTPVSERTLREFCETSPKNIEWLTSYGVKFGSTYYAERIAYPPEEYYLYYSGMEKFRGDHAYVAPRGHRTVGKGATGKFYFAPLRQAALEKGTRLLTHSPVRRLVMDRSGQILGVDIQVVPEERRPEHLALFKRVDPYKLLNGAASEKAIAETAVFERGLPQIRKFIRARRGVVLSAGGYNYNIELFGRYRPIVKRAYKELARGGSMGCDGSGIELGVTVGGGLSHMDRMFCTKAISPPNAFIYGVLVNAEGHRFISEDAYLGTVGCAVAEQSEDGKAWLILDSETFWKGVAQMVWPLKNAFSWWGMPALLNLLLGGTKRARSIKAIAKKCGIDAQQLERTLAAYNDHAQRGEDPDHEKLAQHIKLQKYKSVYALNMSLRNKWGFSGTMPYGGLTVEEQTGAVTRPDGSIIPGLYAAGRTAVGVCSESNFSGLSIADTIFSGRRAARAALKINDF